MSLSERQKRFCEEWIIDGNAAAAYRRAGFAAKTDHQASANSNRLMAKDGIKAEIARLQAERAERTKITQDKVLQQFWAVATANPNELIEHRRICCRHCWGKEFGYQRTEREMDRDLRAWEKAEEAEQRKPAPGAPTLFNEAGGIGYDERRGPNPDCPECFGDGVGKVIAKDTRHLSPEARRLYAGVKITKDGLEVKVHDQMAALVNAAKLQGYFTENVKVSGSLVGWDLSKLSDDELRNLASLAGRASPARPDSSGDDPPRPSEAVPVVPPDS